MSETIHTQKGTAVGYYRGYRILVNRNLTQDGEPYPVKRTWKERLFSRPWRPLVKSRMVTPQVPSDECLVLENEGAIVMHPDKAKTFLEQAP